MPDARTKPALRSSGSVCRAISMRGRCRMSACSVLEVAAHHRKLRIGEHRGNHFDLVVFAGPQQAFRIEAALSGFANGFGPQRVSPGNLEQARAWLRRPRHKRGKKARGWHLSVLRSYLFNQVMAHRHRHYPPGRIVPGDMLCRGMPSAPLWGRGRSSATDVALALEREALAEHAELCAALEHTGLRQDRRAMYVIPRQVRLERQGCAYRLRFWLPAGSYATALLAAAGNVVDGFARAQ